MDPKEKTLEQQEHDFMVDREEYWEGIKQDRDRDLLVLL
jgi:hypothetical protein